MKKPDFLKVTRFGNAFDKLGPLALENIDLKVGKDVVNKKVHMLTKEHGFPKVGIIRVTFVASHFARPYILKIKLYSFDW